MSDDKQKIDELETKIKVLTAIIIVMGILVIAMLIFGYNCVGAYNACTNTYTTLISMLNNFNGSIPLVNSV